MKTKQIEPTGNPTALDNLKSSNIDKDYLVSLYLAASEQNKLYADFRWRVFSYVSTLHAGLMFLVFQAKNNSQIIASSLFGIVISLLLWFLEKRHCDLFYQSRYSGKAIEELMGADHIGVFTTQLREKKWLDHGRIMIIVTLVTLWVWTILLLWSAHNLLSQGS
jgi:hypothetical protein